MTAPRHVRLTFSGTLGTGTPKPEIWSFGLATGPGVLDANDSDVVRTVLTTFAGAARAAFGLTMPTRLSSAVRLTRVRAALVGADGFVERTDEGSYAQGDDNSLIQCTGADNGLPFQCALAVRTQSEFAGPTGRGRFYLPVPATLVLAESGLIEPTYVTNVAASLKVFLDNINTAAVAGFVDVLSVPSGGSPTRGLVPQLHPIQSLKVGRVMDTMRSRRSDLLEDYVTQPVTDPS